MNGHSITVPLASLDICQVSERTWFTRMFRHTEDYEMCIT